MPRGILTAVDLDNIATRALKDARRPPGGDPVVVAYELGFELLPCAPGSSPEYARSTATRLAFASEAGPEAHADRVRLALARGLLLRDGGEHGHREVRSLARRLATVLPERTR